MRKFKYKGRVYVEAELPKAETLTQYNDSCRGCAGRNDEAFCDAAPICTDLRKSERHIWVAATKKKEAPNG